MRAPGGVAYSPRTKMRRLLCSKVVASKSAVAASMVLASLIVGCGDDDPAVFVEPSIGTPEATVGTLQLGTSLKGSFSLSLHLGSRASGPSDVGVGAFMIQNADQSETFVSPLEVSADRDLPVTVDPDSDQTIVFSFDTAADLLPAEISFALCNMEGVVISGAIQDSLQDGATPVVSAVFKPSGC